MTSRASKLRVVGQELVQAALDVEAVLDARAQQRPPGGWKPSSLCGDADDRGRGAERDRLGERADDRRALELSSRPGGVDDGDDGVRRVTEDATGGLAVVRVARVTLGQDDVPLLGRCHGV
jgi:hypothetical protein